MISENTSNLSFKNLQYLLQDRGVENFYFMNEVKDKDLCDIDVYNTIDKYRNKPKQKANFIDKVKVECKENIWYYFREVVRIPDIYHLEANDSSGLARYPINIRMAKLIYLYKNNLTSVIIKNTNDNHIVDLTMAALAIREEFFLTRGIDYDTSILEFYNDNDNLSKFKELMQKLLWAMNDVIGSIDGLSHRVSINMTNYNIFGHIGNKAELVNGTNNLICPHIEKDEDLRKFLNDVRRRNLSTSGICGVFINGSTAINIVSDFMLSERFTETNKTYIFDTDPRDIDRFTIYHI